MKFLSTGATAAVLAAAVLSLFLTPCLAAPNMKAATELDSVLPGVAIANAAPDTPSLLADTAYQQAWLDTFKDDRNLSSRAIGSWNGRTAYVAVAWSVAEQSWVVTLVMVSSLPGGLSDPFWQSREIAMALAANVRRVMGNAPGGVWARKATGFFSSVVAGTGFTIVAKSYMSKSWRNDVSTRDRVVQAAVALSQAYGFGNQVAMFEPTNNKRDSDSADTSRGLIIIADFKPTPELKEKLANNFHAEELGIKRRDALSDSSPQAPHMAKRDEWCPDQSLRDRVIHGWAPWNTDHDVGCII
jgi:hypothetical protein